MSTADASSDRRLQAGGAARLARCGLVFLAAQGLAGCSPEGELAWIRSLAGPIFFGGLKWAVAAGILGFLLAAVCFWAVRRSRTLAPTGTVSKLFRLASLLTLLVAFPICFAYIGFFEGILRSSAHELSEGAFAQEYFPPIGSTGADLVGAVLLAGDTILMADTPVSDQVLQEELAALTAFRSGELEIIAAEIPALIATVDGTVIKSISENLKKDAQQKFPVLQSGRGKQILDWFMDNFSNALVRAALREDLERKGLGSFLDLFGEMIRRLPDAAARDGDKGMLSHQELSAFIVDETIGDGVIKFVIQPFCRVHQAGALVPLLLLLILPIAVLKGPALIARAQSLWADRMGSADAGPETAEEPDRPERDELGG